MACAPRATAFNPEPQTLLMVIAPTASDKPPPNAAWRAGFCPRPAETTLPMMHSSTCSGFRLARFTASRTATAPICTALMSERLPWNFPIAVRAPEMITTSLSSYDVAMQAPSLYDCRFQTFIIRCERTSQDSLDEHARTHHSTPSRTAPPSSRCERPYPCRRRMDPHNCADRDPVGCGIRLRVLPSARRWRAQRGWPHAAICPDADLPVAALRLCGLGHQAPRTFLA